MARLLRGGVSTSKNCTSNRKNKSPKQSVNRLIVLSATCLEDEKSNGSGEKQFKRKITL